MNLDTAQKYLIIAVFGILLTVSSLIIIYIGDIPLVRAKTVSFQDSGGDTLIGKYTPGTMDEGVILLEGFNSDQTAMRSINSEFSSLGFHTFSFDFSGHGRSSGTIKFDNAATDRFANQVLTAKEKFKTLSGLNDTQIILVGHSMGARVALQSAILDPYNVSGLILIGCQVNLIPNVQAGFFTGVSDLELEWVKNLSASNPPVDILLLSGSLDDILTPKSANLLYEKLGGSTAPFERKLKIYPLLFHNYEIYSPLLISDSINWAQENLGDGKNPQYFALQALIRKIFWITALIGLFITPIFGVKYLKETKNGANEDKTEKNEKTNVQSDFRIVNLKKYFIYKLILWLGAIPIALILLSIFFVIPIGIPIFSLVYIGFIGSYGLLMLLLYYKGKVPGTEGKLSINFKPDKEVNNKNNLIAIMASIGFIILCAFFFNSGINYVFPINNKIIWLIIFTCLTVPGFFVGHKEATLLYQSQLSNKKNNVVLWLIGLVPFFIVSIFFGILGSISGMIGSIHGIIILIFAIISGNFIAKINEKPTVATIYQSFLIQFLVLTQCALFSVF
jgi:pimeloyl-ACP methyl ester carboxylesterase